MKRLIALVWGAVSAGIGLLSISPSISIVQRQRLALAQLVATENPGLAMVTGGWAIIQGLCVRSWQAVGLGAVGLGLGIRPLVRRKAVNEAMARAMRDGLGAGWQGKLPPERHQRFGQTHRTDMWGPLRYLATARVDVTRDVLFAAPDGYPLRLDVYAPRDLPGPHPAVIVVHGGSWFYGDKSDYAFGLHDRWLAGQGYVVFDVQYRLTGRWPAPLADVKCAVRWVRTNAARYQVDPARIALIGRSAGGHLALMAAYTANDPTFPPSCVADEEGLPIDERVQAVVASYAPIDLRLWQAEREGAIAHLLGGLPEEVPERYREASPVTHIRPGLPPTMAIHGQRDRTVPPAHSELLVNTLRAAGVTTVALRIPWGRHGVDGLLMGLTGPMIQHDVDRFLAWVFYRDQGQD